MERKIKQKILTFKPLPKLELITQSNLTSLIKKSEKMRKELRGEIVGKLG